jgi:hypothetical protein
MVAFQEIFEITLAVIRDGAGDVRIGRWRGVFPRLANNGRGLFPNRLQGACVGRFGHLSFKPGPCAGSGALFPGRHETTSALNWIDPEGR